MSTASDFVNGELPTGWTYRPISTITEFSTGFTPPTSNDSYYGDDFLWANISDLGKQKYLSTTAKGISNQGKLFADGAPLPVGTLLFSFKLSVGLTAITSAPMYTNEAIAAFPPSSLLDTNYGYYALPAFIPLEAATNIYGAPILNAERIKRARIALPPLKTQRRIADYLDRETGQIDETITRIDKIVELLEERREAFRLSTLFGSNSNAREFTRTRLGPQIPSHWTESKFGLEFRESNEFVGSSPIGPLLSISEYRGIEVNNRTDGQRPSATISHYRTLRRGQLGVNTMWLNHGGLAVSDLDGYISPDYRAYDISRKLDPQFAHHLMRSKPMVNYFAVVSTGVRPNAQRITSTVLQNVPIIVPPMDEQRQIAELLSQEGEKTSQMISKANSVRSLLDERRSALITAAVTGRIQVS